jgi:hypothetical protein
MSCRRAYDIDLTVFLANPRDAAHADFRDHYPRCAACSAEVRAWTEVEGLLRAAEAHPAPEKLLALEEDRDGLAPVERAALEEHVAQCASCHDELAALRGFEPQAVAAAPARGSSLGALLAGLRGLLVQPAFAYALALLFAAPTVYRLVTSESDLLRQAPLENAAPSEPATELREEQMVPRAAVKPTQEVERKDAPAAAAELERMRPARAKASAVLRDEAEHDAPVPESVPLAPLKKEPLRALGYAAREGVAAPVEVRSAENAPPEAQAAESALAESFTADVSRSADAAPASDDLKARRQAPAAPPHPVLTPAGPNLYRLRVPLEPDMREVEIRVSPPGDGRLLAEHFRGAAGEVTLDIPAAWIVPGTWRIERRALGRRDVFELEVP